MKCKSLVIVALLFITCGPNEEDIQSQINAAVEQALEPSTTTTLKPTTSTSTTVPSTTTSIVIYNKGLLQNAYTDEVIEQYIIEWPALLNLAITGIKKYHIETNFDAINARNISIVFSNGCVFESGGNLQKFFPNTNCDKKYTEDDFKKNVTLDYLKIVSKSRNSTSQRPYTIILNSKHKNGNNLVMLPNGYQPCCHKFDLNFIENQLYEFFENYFTTTSTTTTTTTTSTTTTTTLPATTTTTTTLPATTTTTVDSEKQICLYFLESFKIVSDGVKDTGQLESDILNSLSKNNISWASAYELQLEVVDFYSGWLDTWKNAYPNNNNIEFWNNYIEIYRLRALSAISLAEYYYYYDDAYFKESNDYLDQAVSISARTTFNSC